MNDKFTVLIVEDEEAHAALIDKNLKRAGIENPIYIVSNGQEAMDLIQNEQKQAELHIQPESLLILLDLNIPNMDGFQVLEKIRSSKKTENTIIFILTSSANQKEVDRCYHLGCNLFIVKPTDYHIFTKMVEALGSLLRVIKKPESP